MEPLKHFTLLFVEDQQDVLDCYAKIFDRSFKEVIIAKDGIEGYELYKKHRPDFILTDIRMPELNGIEMAKKIREDEKNKIIVFLTAYTDTEYLLEAIELQPVKYFVKPVPARELIKFFETSVDSVEKKCVAFKKNIVYDKHNRVITNQGEEYKLTKMESTLLNLLVENKNDVVPYAAIDKLWGDKFMSVNSLRTLVKNIRHKAYPELIENLPNIGYKLKLTGKE